MKLSDVGGEFGFLDRLSKRIADQSRPELIVGNGDDAAITSTPDGFNSAITTDLLVEGVHFRLDWSAPFDIGWKSAAVNLSDIASMGGVPKYAFLCLAMPPDIEIEFLDRFYDGFIDCLNESGAVLAGGDTSSSPGGLTISVTLIGNVPEGHHIVRSGARPGDLIVVTGSLGDSRAGLELLNKYGPAEAMRKGTALVQRHLRPCARTAFGIDLGQHEMVSAGMDISDGLHGDIARLCRASGVGATIDLDELPLSTDVMQANEMLDESPEHYALYGGEDYELLLCVSPNGLDNLTELGVQHRLPIRVIGEITSGNLLFKHRDGRALEESRVTGWDHFTE